MRRMLGLATAAGLGLAGLAVPAQAMPLAPGATVDTGSAVELVRNGCGIGWHRDPFGVCVENRDYYFDRRVYVPAYPTAVYRPAVVSPAPVYDPYAPRYIAPPRVIYYQ